MGSQKHKKLYSWTRVRFPVTTDLKMAFTNLLNMSLTTDVTCWHITAKDSEILYRGKVIGVTCLYE